ncbi:nuclear speckle splicing regulatory protein 1 [Cocos nucifera]|uniref:Nuclear speckle splicing regulatory protein 1 n=1 Tax=Cocos nucifera TaxID=13894 RepID=A0A8K0N3Q9_COCNU|nr:nuclear speckle splicing regulatory protein 1 [Cocos nucifera]
MKYGLQLRIPPGQQKPAAAKSPLCPPPVFGDDDEDDVEREISRQASKNKALQKIEEQHKKALEEDPSVFDYDGVYDEMKEKVARPKIQDRTERKSKYIEVLMQKAKQREVEHEIIYERKLLKERSKDDHLFADKEKFVTSAYKKKLAEQAKWLEEEKLRQIRTKDLVLPTLDRDEASTRDSQPETSRSEKHSEQAAVETAPEIPVIRATTKEKTKAEQALPAHAAERYKRSEDALAAARERYLARKRAREQ